MANKAVLSILLVFIFFVSSFAILNTGVQARPIGSSSETVSILQDNVYVYEKTFSPGFTGSAYINPGVGKINYIALMGAAASSVAQITISSVSGQQLSSAKGNGGSATDSFDFNFSTQSEYVMELYFQGTMPAPSTTIATTTNGVLAVSQDKFVYDYSTNTQSAGKVFTFTQNVVSSSLQATIYIYQKGYSPPSQDTVHFQEYGLPVGTMWLLSYQVYLAGYRTQNQSISSPTRFLNFSVSGGSIVSYSIADTDGFIPSPHLGTIGPLYGNTKIYIEFAAPSTGTYPITFTPSGLPANSTWGVTLAGQTLYGSSINNQNPDIIFNELNGTYSFTVDYGRPATISPDSGQVTVNGAAMHVAISFTVATYPLSFKESGLPPGTSWSVSVNGSMKSSNTSTITFDEPVGTYLYSINGLSGYNASPSSGTVMVGPNSATWVSVTFSPTSSTYLVTFMESGLPSGTAWSVLLNGQSLMASIDMITFSGIPTGTYGYTASAVGYTSQSGSVIVSGTQGVITQDVVFTSQSVNYGPPTATITSTGNFRINGTISPPSGSNELAWNMLSVGISGSNYANNFVVSPVPWTFSIQAPSSTATYTLSLRLLGNSIESGWDNLTVTMTSGNTTAYMPSSYSFSPSQGSVIFSSQSIMLLLDGPVSYSVDMQYSSAYGQSGTYNLTAQILSNGTQEFPYGINVNAFNSGLYTFKYVVYYQGKVVTSLSVQYDIEGSNAITLKYSYSYARTVSGTYNVSMTILTVDNSSTPYSPINALNVSYENDTSHIVTNIGFVRGYPVQVNGLVRDQFNVSMAGLPMGAYSLVVSAYNVSGNEMTPMFNSNFSFEVPSLAPPTTGGSFVNQGINWLMQGNNGYIVLGLVAVIFVAGIIAYSGSGRRGNSYLAPYQPQSPAGRGETINISVGARNKSKNRTGGRRKK